MIIRKTTLKQKVFLILFGLFMSLIIIEVALRFCSLVMLSLQDQRNLASIRQKCAYRILCIGESTTAEDGNFSYPSQLEKILNHNNTGLRFSVINKGVQSTNTSAIVSVLDGYLNKYKPNMVIAMMGINDERGINQVYKKGEISALTAFLRSFRVCKLARLIRLRIEIKYKELPSPKLLNDADTVKPNDNIVEHNFSIDGVNYFIKAHNYKEQGKNLEAIKYFKKTIAVDPLNDQAYTELGWIYGIQNDEDRAKLMYKKALELNPCNKEALIELGWRCRNNGEYNKAEKLLKKALEVNPYDHVIYMELAWLYREKKEYFKEEALLKKGLKMNPDNEVLLGALLTFYNVTGNINKANEYRKKVFELEASSFNPVTRLNYLRLKKILDKKGIKLVCVQYPLCRVEFLKNMLEDQDGIIFIDNEKIFKTAIKNSSYSEYFYDMFAGVFGHCTEKGNRLLAQNIAGVILKKVFKQ